MSNVACVKIQEPIMRLLLLLAGCFELLACATRTAVQTPRAPAEVRALWVVRTSLTSPSAIQKLVADAQASGINALVVQVRGRGDAYYRSHWEPRATALKEQSESFDPLAEVLSQAHRAGIQVHAWLNTHLLANLNDLPADGDHVYWRHPEWLAVPRKAAGALFEMDPGDPRYRERILEVSKEDVRELEGIYTSPSHPAVWEHLTRVFLDVVEGYDVDGVHFDYVRYPNPDFDYSRTALERFRAMLEPSLPPERRRMLAALAASAPLVYTEAFPQEWDRFRRDEITDLVAKIYQAVKARRPDIEVSAAVFANDDDAFHRRFQDWKGWMERGILDVVCPMAYTPDTEIWKRQVAVARGFSFGRRVWAGIGAYRQPPECTLEKITLARRIGVEGVIFFSYGQMVSPSAWAPSGDYLDRIAKEAFR